MLFKHADCWPDFLVACNAVGLYAVTCNEEIGMPKNDVNARVNKHRAALRMAGLRPVQIWVPDTRRPNFAEECRRQSSLITRGDADDMATQRLMDHAVSDLDGWEA